jgi:hypothetical protein
MKSNAEHPRYRGLAEDRRAARLAEDTLELTAAQRSELLGWMAERGWLDRLSGRGDLPNHR